MINEDDNEWGNLGASEKFNWSSRQHAKKGLPGTKHTPEQLAKMSEAQKGKVVSKETKALIRIARAKQVITHSDETRAKMSEAQKGKVVSAETRAKLSAASKGRNLGKKASAETRAKMSAASKGKKHSAETRAKIGATSKGRKPSAETRAKMSAATKGRPKSAETRAKMKESNARATPIVTPNGVFASISLAIAQAKSDGLPNAHRKIRKWVKEFPKDYYYITKEEYQRLKK
jgi:hypothetical protein